MTGPGRERAKAIKDMDKWKRTFAEATRIAARIAADSATAARYIDLLSVSALPPHLHPSRKAVARAKASAARWQLRSDGLIEAYRIAEATFRNAEMLPPDEQRAELRKGRRRLRKTRWLLRENIRLGARVLNDLHRLWPRPPSLAGLTPGAPIPPWWEDDVRRFELYEAALADVRREMQ